MPSKHYISHTNLFALWVVTTDSPFIPMIITVLSEDILVKELYQCIITWISSSVTHIAVAEVFPRGVLFFWVVCFIWSPFLERSYFFSVHRGKSHILHNTCNFPFDTLKCIYYTEGIKSACCRLTTPNKTLLFSVRGMNNAKNLSDFIAYITVRWHTPINVGIF